MQLNQLGIMIKLTPAYEKYLGKGAYLDLEHSLYVGRGCSQKKRAPCSEHFLIAVGMLVNIL